MRVLVVEDEDVMAQALSVGLRRAGFAVDMAGDGGSALALASVHAYDVILLDRDLPVLHGDEVCRRLCGGDSGAKILMLTAAGAVDERVFGLGLGADDYLPKPFAFAEVLARVHALMRRPTPALPAVLTVGDVQVDTPRLAVTRGGEPVVLGLKEFAVLVELARAQGAVVSAEELLERVWDEHADPFSNVVRVTMVGLRRKLGDPPVIETIRGAGYRLVR